MKKINSEDRQYWLWVTTPQFYLEEDGSDREMLEPRDFSYAGGWWTCSKNTKKGDLIFLWRARGAKDIKYLIQAESDAYTINDNPRAKKFKWIWGCDYKPIYKFANSITLSDLRKHHRLQEWNVLKAQFQSKAFKVQYDDWNSICELAIEKEPDFKQILDECIKGKLLKAIFLEEQLEEEIANNLRILKKYGYDLELYIDQNENITGRQYICYGHGGRIDLLCKNKTTNGFTIIELKNVRANRLAFGQIFDYIGYIQNVFKNKNVNGILINRGSDPGFQQAVKVVPGKIRQIDIQELGFE